MKFLETKLFSAAILIMIPVLFIYDDIFSGNYLNQILLFILPLIWPGLAHGSLDISIAKKYGLITNRNQTFIFVFIYILIPFIFFILWLSFPDTFFIIFLILSIIHFGISDSILNKERSNVFEIPLRGILVISLPFQFHLEKTIEIFSFFLVDKEFIEKIIPFFYFLNIFLISWIIIFFIKNISSIFSNLNYSVFIIEFSLLFFCFWYFEPLLSFFIYFCFLHSTRHLIDEMFNLDLKLNELIIKTIPMTLLTLIFFLGVLIFFEDESNYINISYIVIGLSSLTTSHIFLVNFTKKKH